MEEWIFIYLEFWTDSDLWIQLFATRINCDFDLIELYMKWKGKEEWNVGVNLIDWMD